MMKCTDCGATYPNGTVHECPKAIEKMAKRMMAEHVVVLPDSPWIWAGIVGGLLTWGLIFFIAGLLIGRAL